MTASAGRLLTAFAKMNRKGDIFQYVDRVSESQFTEMLENMTVELEQLLKTLSLGSADAVGTMVNQLLDAVTMKIRHLLNADRATLFMVDETNQMLRSRIAESGGGEPLLISIPITAGIAGMVAREDITLNIPDPYAHPAFDRSVDMRTGYVTRNLLCMPIHDRAKKVFAVAQLLNRKEEGPFTREDEQKFRAFAGPIGLILENCLRLESPVGSGTGAHSN
jgi:signal transduction protein with GAF and PtsI domain